MLTPKFHTLDEFYGPQLAQFGALGERMVQGFAPITVVYPGQATQQKYSQPVERVPQQQSSLVYSHSRNEIIQDQPIGDFAPPASPVHNFQAPSQKTVPAVKSLTQAEKEIRYNLNLSVGLIVLFIVAFGGLAISTVNAWFFLPAIPVALIVSIRGHQKREKIYAEMRPQDSEKLRVMVRKEPSKLF